MLTNANADDFFSLLDSEETELPALPEAETGKQGTPDGDLSTLDWKEDPVSGKLEKIRAVFLNAKSPQEVHDQAATMPIGDWLETVGKMSKSVETGPVQITAIRIELPPREAFVSEAIEVEIPR